MFRLVEYHNTYWFHWKSYVLCIRVYCVHVLHDYLVAPTHARVEVEGPWRGLADAARPREEAIHYAEEDGARYKLGLIVLIVVPSVRNTMRNNQSPVKVQGSYEPIYCRERRLMLCRGGVTRGTR